jgi:trehalose 6-phosphate synthase/phosphatase
MEGRAVLRPSDGGLVSGLRDAHQRSDSLWFGCPGNLHGLDADTTADVKRHFTSSRIVPVCLEPRHQDAFYEGVSNSVLWPVFHDRLDLVPLRQPPWDAYERANARFADAVCAHYRDGDVIWVHDYLLLRLPALLRQRLPNARIGFFLHIPFPGLESFSTLPRRRELLEGVLGADLVGFHVKRYATNFATAIEHLLDVHVDRQPNEYVARHRGRHVRLGVFPMGVDARAFTVQAQRRQVILKTLDIRSMARRIMVGIDRLDYSKGIPRRLLAFEQLLTEHTEWRERVQLVQVAVPSRERVPAYRRFRHAVEALVTRINGALATPGWTPIQYLHRSVVNDLLVALYRAADVMLVTPVRDGMNLVAKEFVASRVDGDGVLVLSEFAGASSELHDALVINPYDVDGVARAMQMALTMPGHERRARMSRMRSHVNAHDVHHWVDSFLKSLTVSTLAPRET